MIEVQVAGLGRIRGGAEVLLLLEERDGSRVLPIGIGPYEAEAIALHLNGTEVPRPLTHDLLTRVLAGLDARLLGIEISALARNTFHARLLLEQAGKQVTIDSRPSDAVALAVRAPAPIYVAEAVLDEAGFVPETPEEPAEPPPAADLSLFEQFIESLDDQEPDRGSPESSA